MIFLTLFIILIFFKMSSYKYKIGIVSMMKKPKNIDTWLKKHRDLGIHHFFIRLEETPEIEKYLQSQDDVYLQIGNSNGDDEYKDIQSRQKKWVNETLKISRMFDCDWLIHIDADEILEGDLDSIHNLESHIRTFWIQNLEVKFNKVPISTDNCFSNEKKFINCSIKGSGCVSYINGKSGGRTTFDVSIKGPHRMKSFIEIKPYKLDSLFVKHYESCDFDIYKQKFTNLSNKNSSKIPFRYYNESINAIKVNDDNKLYEIYEKYRVS